MGKKLLVSLAMEGKFSSEGLQSINDEDDILMAMARELVTEKEIGEKADEVWSTLQKTQEATLGAIQARKKSRSGVLQKGLSSWPHPLNRGNPPLPTPPRMRRNSPSLPRLPLQNQLSLF